MSAAPGPYHLASTYLRLRPDASVEALPGGAPFWDALLAGKLGSFHHEYLVIVNDFDAAWPMWEMHPNGDEIVCLLAGAVDFTLELGLERRVISLRERGAYVVVPKGTWHTATTQTSSSMLFITAGEGTQHRPAQPD
jgi:hypothetical protein